MTQTDARRAQDRARYQDDPERKAATKARAKAHYESNREEQIARKTAWNRANPAARRRVHLKAKYGITPEDYNSMYAEQEGRCGICRDAHSLLVVDHDHETGRIRGLLCRKCNAAIGQLKDDPALLWRALAWLED